MSQQADLINSDIDAYLAEHQRKELLRFFTCGNVDDGKSTLIGRLLHDQHKIYADQLAAVCADSVKSGTTGAGKIDLALLVDGLQAEREQGITIDVAYRYFSTSIRKFIIADTPGHEQYTRNMATGASTCHLAVILIDARYGVQTQTKRHSYIASLLGIKHTIIAINKMDLVGYSESIYAEIQQDYLNFSACLQMHDCHFIPMSALDGDNVVDKGDNMAWYGGKTLLETLNTVEIACDLNYSDTRFPVQYVNRPSADFRGFCGTLAGGVLRQGDEITALPSGKSSRIKRIVTDGGDLEVAYPGAALTITLQDEIDISRGDMLVAGDNPPKITDTLDAMVVWMHETPLQANRQYIVKLATRNCNATLAVHFCQDINTLAQHPADQLHLNEIGSCQLNLNAPVVCDSYQQNKACGSFIIIDRLSNMTVGAGMVSAAADTLTAAAVSHAERAQRDNQTAAVILLDGCDLTKTQQLERKLFTNGHIVTVVPNPSAEILVALKNAGLICLVHENNGLHDIIIDGTATLAAMYQALKEHKIIG